MSKTIVISAAADGIGLCITNSFLDKGYTVFASDINQKKIDILNEHPLINNKLFIHRVDAGDANSVKSYFESLKLSSIDAIINNVGIAGPTETMEDISVEDWNQTIETNLNSHFYFTKYAIPLLKNNKGGSIVNLSSTGGIFGFPLRTAYAASNWAIFGITKSLAMELGEFNIRVNAICPGSVSGERMDRVIKAKAKSLEINENELREDFEDMVSLRTFVDKEDIANMAVFLLSDQAHRISGQIMTVDGNTERMN